MGSLQHRCASWCNFVKRRPAAHRTDTLCASAPLPARAEVHAKAPIVRGAHGNLLRFCQQCSKLQPLVEFKGQQRSCMAAQAKRECGWPGPPGRPAASLGPPLHN